MPPPAPAPLSAGARSILARAVRAAAEAWYASEPRALLSAAAASSAATTLLPRTPPSSRGFATPRSKGAPQPPPVMPHYPPPPDAPPKKPIHCTVNGRRVTLDPSSLPAGAQWPPSLLDACTAAGASVPTLCRPPKGPASRNPGTCRVCMVELEPSPSASAAKSAQEEKEDPPPAVLKPACCTPLPTCGARIRTDSPAVVASVRGTLALLRRNHPEACMGCCADGRCEFQDLVQRYQVPLLLPKAPHLERLRVAAASAPGAANALADPRAAASPQPGGGPAAAVGRDAWLPYDASSTAIALDADKCILCGRCVDVCANQQGMDVLAFYGRGQDRHLGFSASDAAHSHCIGCGQCVASCPVGALSEKTEWREVLGLLQQQQQQDQGQQPRVAAASSSSSPSHPSCSSNRSHSTLPERRPQRRRRPVMVAQTAPSVRVALAEEVGLAPGTVTTGQMVAALRALGFDVVFDTDMSADLTIMEEGNELLGRLAEAWASELEGEEHRGAAPSAASASPAAPPPALPMFTSCCPAWVHLVETDYPSLIPHLSSCKSPQGMLAAVVKRVWWPRERERRRRERLAAAAAAAAAAARGGGKDQDEQDEAEEEERCVHVSVMPCVAKKEEARRPQLAGDVDFVLTTRELGRMLRLQRIPVASLPSDAPESRYDDPLGTGTGAGVLFGASGGVMEAALRTVAELATGEELGDRLAFSPVDAPFARPPARSPYNHATGSGHSPGGGELLEASLELPVAAILRLGLKDKERAERAIAALERQGRAEERKRVRVCVANGVAAARRLLDAHFAAVSADSSSPSSPLARYHFLEVMSCVGGCVNGGGQPKAPPPRPGHPETAWPSVVAARTAAIRALDRAAPLRRSHLNPDVRKLYGMDGDCDDEEEEEGGKGGGGGDSDDEPPIAPPRLRGGVGGHDAHVLLHTTYGPPGGGGGGQLSPPYPSERRARAAAGEGEKGGGGSG